MIGRPSGSDDHTGKEASNAAAAPFARLTATQYANTVRDLFAPLAVQPGTLPTDPTVGGYDDNTSAQTPSSALIEAVHASAARLANTAVAKGVLGCAPASRQDEDACAQTFVRGFGKRAYRHPLSPQEETDLLALYANERMTEDFSTAMTLVLQAMLESPRFLYRVEIGAPAAASTVALTPWEMASRLSYFLWNTMPDDALFAAAESGELGTPEGVDKQARRLLTDPKAHDAVLRFHRQWLRFDKMDSLTKDPMLFPSFNTSTASALRSSAEKFVDGIFFGQGTLSALLTDTHAWVNADIAPIYGATAQGADLALVDTDPTQRAGILTNAGLMAGFAHDNADSPVLRGVFVLDRLLCNAPPPPPPNIKAVPPPVDLSKPMTTRDRFATQHEQGACAGCHHAIDGIGFGFEHYDAIGQWRTTDIGLPVDSSGWLPSPAGSDLTGTFDGAVDLAKRMAQSDTVRSCVAQHWLRYAIGVEQGGIDPAQLAPITAAFKASGDNLRELVIALTKSDAFRSRVVMH